MMMSEPLRFTALRGTLARDVPLARYTSWRCGGPGDRVYLPADRDDLASFIRQLPPGEPLTAIGLGSNLLVRDGGIRGTVVVLHAALNALELRDGLIYAEAGVASPKVARFAATHGYADAEFLAGLPGTVGGALAMNAGCYGREPGGYAARVEVRLPLGASCRRRRARRHLHRGMVRVSAGRQSCRAGADRGAAAAAHRGAAAQSAERRQRVSQPCRRPCGAADRELRAQGLCRR